MRSYGAGAGAEAGLGAGEGVGAGAVAGADGWKANSPMNNHILHWAGNYFPQMKKIYQIFPIEINSFFVIFKFSTKFTYQLSRNQISV